MRTHWGLCESTLFLHSTHRNLSSDAKQEDRHQIGCLPSTRCLQAYALSWVLLSIVELEFAQKKLVSENELFTENKLSCLINSFCIDFCSDLRSHNSLLIYCQLSRDLSISPDLSSAIHIVSEEGYIFLLEQEEVCLQGEECYFPPTYFLF